MHLTQLRFAGIRWLSCRPAQATYKGSQRNLGFTLYQLSKTVFYTFSLCTLICPLPQQLVAMASALMTKFAGASLRAAVPTQGRVSLPMPSCLASVRHCLASHPAANAPCCKCILHLLHAGHTPPVSLHAGQQAGHQGDRVVRPW